MNSDITPLDFKDRLLNDPNYVINFIIDNNPSEVIKRTIQLEFGGFTQDITTKEDVLQVINYLLKNGDMSKVKYILSVPTIPENIPSIYLPIIESATSEAYIRLVERGVYPKVQSPILTNGMSI